METFLNYLYNLLAGLAVFFGFSLIVFIHEFGHFLAAKAFHFKIDVFSIGFGPAVWKRKFGGVEYRISAIPFGGYVALPQLDPSGMEKIQGGKDSASQAVRPASPWKRIVVAAAGPFGNVVLAVVLAYVIYWTPQAKTGVIETRIGGVVTNSAAYAAGLRAGDVITAVNGQRVTNWPDLSVENLLAGDSGRATFAILRDKQSLSLTIPLDKDPVYNIWALGGVYPKTPCLVERVQPNSAADKAGLHPGDLLQSVNGVPVFSVSHFIALVTKNGAKPADFVYRRGQETKASTITPIFDEVAQHPVIGVIISGGNNIPWMMYRDPWKQLQWDSMSVIRLLKGLVAPKEKGQRAAIASNIGGPPMILMSLFAVVRNSMLDTIGFLRMLCVNLAILNILPIPILDGGHILFALFEILTRRKPNPKFIAVVSNAFAFLLIALMLLLSYRDIAGKIHRDHLRAEAERESVPAAQAPAATGERK